MRERNFVLPMFVLVGAFAFGVQPLGAQTIPEQIQPERKVPGATQPDRGGTLGTEPGAGAMHQDPDTVRAVQQALQEKGFDPGEINGIIGPETQEAIRSFQKANGLPVTGQLDAETSQQLGIAQSPSPGTEAPGSRGGLQSPGSPGEIPSPSRPGGAGNSGGLPGKGSGSGLGR